MSEISCYYEGSRHMSSSFGDPMVKISIHKLSKKSYLNTCMNSRDFTIYLNVKWSENIVNLKKKIQKKNRDFT